MSYQTYFKGDFPGPRFQKKFNLGEKKSFEEYFQEKNALKKERTVLIFI